MKKRLDIILVEQGFYPSREKAKANVMAGNVFVDGQRADKPGTNYKDDIKITVKKDLIPYVGRGGLKLEKAIKSFNLELKERTCMDIGASTGGFTDCMLQNGASKVYSIDVGYGQLADKLRRDERVVCMERTNFRYLEREKISEEISFAVIDVSFISLRLILPKLKEFLKDSFEVIALIKPQFESKREEVGKNGVVRDIKVHKRVVGEIVNFAKENGFYLKDLTFSPIKGQKGNIEYLAYFTENNSGLDEEMIEKIVDNSHLQLDL